MRSAALIISVHTCSPLICLHYCQYLSVVSRLVCLPCTLLFMDDRRGGKKHLAFLFRVQKQQDVYWKKALQTGLASTHGLKMRKPCVWFSLSLFFKEGNWCWTALTWLFNAKRHALTLRHRKNVSSSKIVTLTRKQSSSFASYLFSKCFYQMWKSLRTVVRTWWSCSAFIENRTKRCTKDDIVLVTLAAGLQ